jgi:hypothetical protein
MNVAVCKPSVLQDTAFCCKGMFKVMTRWDKRIGVLGDVLEEY